VFRYIKTFITIRPICFNFCRVFTIIYFRKTYYTIYNFTGVLWLQLTVHLTLFTMLNFISIFIIIINIILPH